MGSSGVAREPDKQLQRPSGSVGPPSSFERWRPRAPAPAPPSAPPSTREEEVLGEGPQATGAERGRPSQAPEALQCLHSDGIEARGVPPPSGPTLGACPPRRSPSPAPQGPAALPGLRSGSRSPAGFRLRPDAALGPPYAPHPVQSPAQPQRV